MYISSLFPHLLQDVVKAVEGVGSGSGRTRAPVMIADCGQLS